MRLIPLLAVIALSLVGCEDRMAEIKAGSVQVYPHTYAMTNVAFHDWAYNQGYREPTQYPDMSLPLGGSFRPYTQEKPEQFTGWLGGLTVERVGAPIVCAIPCNDPHHLSYDDELRLIHEMGHREDATLGKGPGFSHYWVLLSQCKDGQFYLTHPEVNAQLRKEGYNAP
jgi:hypothetical protein